jgi:hypothetical protein
MFRIATLLRLRSASLAGLCALASLALACADAAYRHEVEGKVLDAAGQPLADCKVARVNDKGDPYGHDELYLRTTDAQGAFRFESAGRGPTPLASAPWRLKVTPKVGAPLYLDIDAKWSEDKAVCFGYCAKGLVLKAPAAK